MVLLCCKLMAPSLLAGWAGAGDTAAGGHPFSLGPSRRYDGGHTARPHTSPEQFVNFDFDIVFTNKESMQDLSEHLNKQVVFA